MYTVVLLTYNQRGIQTGEIVIPYLSDYASAVSTMQARRDELESEGLTVRWSLDKA